MNLSTGKVFLRKLIEEGIRWQNITITNEEHKPKFFFSKIQWLVIILVVLIQPFAPNGFDKDIVGYFITAISIIIGLLLSLIISMFDKKNIVYPKDNEQERIKFQKKVIYFKQFISLTSYAVLISIILVILLIFGTMLHEYELNPFKKGFFYHFMAFGQMRIYWGNILLTPIILGYRIIVSYLLIDVFLILGYAVSSTHNYMFGELNDIPIPWEKSPSTPPNFKEKKPEN